MKYKGYEWWSFLMIFLILAVAPVNPAAISSSDRNLICIDREDPSNPLVRLDPQLRFCHLSPDCPRVDIWLDGSIVLFSAIGFQESTPYVTTSSGTHVINVVPMGGQPSDSLLNLENQSFESDQLYTLVIFDRTSNLSGLILLDEAAAAEDRFVMRLMHVAYILDSTDIDIITIPIVDPPQLVWDDLSFGQAGEPIEFAIMNHRLGVDTNDDMIPETSFLLPTIAGGSVINAYFGQELTGAFFMLLEYPDGSVTKIDPVPPHADLRFTHLGPDAGPLDIWLNQTVILVSNLVFEEGTQSIWIEPGSYRLDFVPHDLSPAQSILTLDSVGLATATNYSCSLYGLVGGLSALITIDDVAPIPDKVRTRFVHEAVGYDELGVYLVDADGGSTMLWQNVGYGSATDYHNFDAGSILLGIDEDADGGLDDLFDLSTLAAETIANIYAVFAQGRFFLMVQADDNSVTSIEAEPDPAYIRVINLSPDAGSVDIWLDKLIRIGENLGFQDGSTYMAVDGGMNHTIQVVSAGGSPQEGFLIVPDVLLTEYESYTFAVYGAMSGIEGLVLNDDIGAIPSDRVRLRAVHTGVSLGIMDIWNIPDSSDPVLIWSDLSFGQPGGVVEFPVSTNRFCIDLNDDGSGEFCMESPTLPESLSLNLFVVVDDSSQVFLVYQFPDGSSVGIAGYEPCSVMGVTLTIPSVYIRPNDPFWVKAIICNPGDSIIGDIFVAFLDVGTGDYWFYPSWQSYPPMDHRTVDLTPGENSVAVIEEFQWPDTGTQHYDDITITAALLNDRLTTVIGEIDTVTFDYGP